MFQDSTKFPHYVNTVTEKNIRCDLIKYNSLKNILFYYKAACIKLKKNFQI